MQKERFQVVQEPYENWFLRVRRELHVYSASYEARPGFERDCAHLDIQDGSGVVVEVLDATADPRRNLEDA
jgi:hypothetical protein